MNYTEAIQFLYDLRMFGAKFGLENTRKLAALAGNPQDRLRFIHVAGTNGKGSTCAMLESIYRTAGLRVGLFTSPHLVSFSERIQINRQPISDSDVIRLVSQMQSLLRAFPMNEHPTFFEAVTVIALQYFAEQSCDLVIWETGLGGRLDATNIVIPLASVITNVQYDHQKWLGATLREIATEKAGIIKAKLPVITAADEAEVIDVIERTASNKQSPLVRVGKQSEALVESIRLPLLGQHQKTNAALAVEVVRTLQNDIPVSEEQICSGLESVYWPGRLQIFRKGERTFLLDGAHNPAGIETLAKTIRAEFPDLRVLIVGLLADKDWRVMCQKLAVLAPRIIFVPVHSERTLQPAEIISELNDPRGVVAKGSLAEALESTMDVPFVGITGSLYLIGEAMELLGISPARNERGLNEWQATASKQK